MTAMVIDGKWPATDTPELKKARGAFFTPQDVSDFLATWAIRSTEDRILEPSAGEAAFLLSATRRLTALGAVLNSVSLDGVEIHAASAARARSLVGLVGAKANIVVGDFLSLPTKPVFDAVVGNPPYIRYQDFAGDDRRAAQKAALAQGVRLTKLASSWAGGQLRR
jgi:adenine-specific DNA-methyltransferase